jgi:hypothetical protein
MKVVRVQAMINGVLCIRLFLELKEWNCRKIFEVDFGSFFKIKTLASGIRIAALKRYRERKEAPS